MITHQVELESTGVGTSCNLTLRTFGPPSGRKALYIQAALHAAEVPGLLVLQHFLAMLAKLEESDRLLHRVTVATWANPIGMAQHLMGHLTGRFDLGGTGNFDRNFCDVRSEIGATFGTAEQRIPSTTELKSWLSNAALKFDSSLDPVHVLKRQLLAIGFEHDAVLDLHCDKTAMMHIYSSWDYQERAAALAQCMGAPILILEDEAGGGTFDQAFRDAWRKIKSLGISRDPAIGFAAVVELRGQRDVSDELAVADAAGLVDFLRSEGIARTDTSVSAGPAPAIVALNAIEHVAAPSAGVIAWKAACGQHVTRGAVIAEIAACDSEVPGRRTPIHASASGTLIARAHISLVTPGQHVAMIGGNEALPDRQSGKLLHD